MDVTEQWKVNHITEEIYFVDVSSTNSEDYYRKHDRHNLVAKKTI